MNISELEGAELDLAVAKSLGLIPGLDGYMNEVWYKGREVFGPVYGFSPSTIWAQGGKLIEENEIGVWYDGEEWGADRLIWPTKSTSYGPTPLIAAMRALVSSLTPLPGKEDE